MFRWLSSRHVKTRLTAWYLFLLGIVLVVFSVGITLLLERSLEDGLDDNVQERTVSLVAVLETEDGEPRFPDAVVAAATFDEFDDDSDDPIVAQDEEPFARTYDVDGNLASNAGANPVLPQPNDMIATAIDGHSSMATIGQGEDSFRVLVRPVLVDGAVIGAIEVGLPREDLVETVDGLISIIIFAIPLTLIAATAGGWLLARRALQPVDLMTSLAREISAEDLSRRLDMKLPDDEFGRLARTLDNMIARLDIAFQRQRQFTADASHELRTPLTAMKGHLDVTRERPRSVEEYQDALDRIDREVDRMTKLVQRLLVLARADSGQIPVEFEFISASQLVEAATEQHALQASQQGVNLTTTPGPDVTLSVDQSLMLQLLMNLIDNALRHTSPGDSVDVRWSRSGNQIAIEVEDTGTGIDEDDLPHIFERFYRADRARSRREGSAGLGLAISRWIAQAHGGSISVQSEPGRGSCFTVHLPVSDMA
jgi:heavy metal sensor kinase